VNSTAPLNILGDFSMDEKTINTHPNDGFDLGLMTTEHVVRIHVGSATDPDAIPETDFIHGKIHLRNEVKNGHLEMGLRAAEKLGGARRAVVHYARGDRYGTILITPA
jgi:hypothetical protein